MRVSLNPNYHARIDEANFASSAGAAKEIRYTSSLMLRTLAVISFLLLCVVLFLIFLASSDKQTEFYWAGRSHQLYLIAFGRGSVFCEWVSNWPNAELGWWKEDEINAGPVLWPDTFNPPIPWKSPTFGHRLGMGHAILHSDGTTWYGKLNNVEGRSFGPEGKYLDIWFPIWPIVSLSGILPAWMIGRMLWRCEITKIRKANGRCSKCGYDLRGTPDQCPECGTLTRHTITDRVE
jgi:hypothetical protein